MSTHAIPPKTSARAGCMKTARSLTALGHLPWGPLMNVKSWMDAYALWRADSGRMSSSRGWPSPLSRKASGKGHGRWEGGKCLRALALPKDMDDLAGCCPAERTWDHGAVLSHRYELKRKVMLFFTSPVRPSRLTALQLHLAFRTCSGPTGH